MSDIVLVLLWLECREIIASLIIFSREIMKGKLDFEVFCNKFMQNLCLCSFTIQIRSTTLSSVETRRLPCISTSEKIFRLKNRKLVFQRSLLGRAAEKMCNSQQQQTKQRLHKLAIDFSFTFKDCSFLNASGVENCTLGNGFMAFSSFLVESCFHILRDLNKCESHECC